MISTVKKMEEKNKTSDRIRLIFNLFLFGLILFTWISMSLSARGERLQSSGFWNVKYFTVLSNLFEAMACILFVVSVPVRRLRVFAETVKYTATVCLMVTFTVVLVFLGPAFGYAGLYSGTLMFMHLIVPLVSFAEFIFFCRPYHRFTVTLFPVLAVFLYGAFYLANILVNGVGEMPAPNDFYGFTAWGMGFGIVIYASICLATWGMSVAFRSLNLMIAKKTNRDRSEK